MEKLYKSSSVQKLWIIMKYFIREVDKEWRRKEKRLA
jgi:hypothetical protein